MAVGRTTEPRSVTVTVPGATITTKALTSNVATLTTSASHPFVTGQPVVVVGVDATFNGTYSITATTATTFSYAKTAANVASAASAGSATSTPLTAPAATFNEEDAGRAIIGAGIPAGSTLAVVTSDTAATLSAAATAAGTVTASLGGGLETLLTGQRYGFVGWSPETDAESEAYTVAANNAGVVPPDRITNATTAVARRARVRG